jgi:hypothetical protein
MSQQLAKAWEDEINEKWLNRLERATEQAKEENSRATLRRQLQKRFGAIPEDLDQRIGAADLAHLEAALDQFVDLTALEQLKL